MDFISIFVLPHIEKLQKWFLYEHSVFSMEKGLIILVNFREFNGIAPKQSLRSFTKTTKIRFFSFFWVKYDFESALKRIPVVKNPYIRLLACFSHFWRFSGDTKWCKFLGHFFPKMAIFWLKNLWVAESKTMLVIAPFFSFA